MSSDYARDRIYRPDLPGMGRCLLAFKASAALAVLFWWLPALLSGQTLLECYTGANARFGLSGFFTPIGVWFKASAIPLLLLRVHARRRGVRVPWSTVFIAPYGALLASPSMWLVYGIYHGRVEPVLGLCFTSGIVAALFGSCLYPFEVLLKILRSDWGTGADPGG